MTSKRIKVIDALSLDEEQACYKFVLFEDTDTKRLYKASLQCWSRWAHPSPRISDTELIARSEPEPLFAAVRRETTGEVGW